MSRSLIEYFLFGGAMSDISSNTNLSPFTVIPDAGVIRTVIVGVHTIIATAAGVNQTFDILVNDVDTLVDCGFADGLIDERGIACDMGGTVEVQEGDTVRLRSNGEQAAATIADLTWVISRGT